MDWDDQPSVFIMRNMDRKRKDLQKFLGYGISDENFIQDILGKLPESGDSKRYRLKLLQNLHGLKDVGTTWFNHLTKRLMDMGFQQGLVR